MGLRQGVGRTVEMERGQDRLFEHVIKRTN